MIESGQTETRQCVRMPECPVAEDCCRAPVCDVIGASAEEDLTVFEPSLMPGDGSVTCRVCGETARLAIIGRQDHRWFTCLVHHGSVTYRLLRGEVL